MTDWFLGVMGGSGVYDVVGLEDARWERVETPWGAPSDAIRRGRLNGVEVAFLPRHGRGHPHSPTSINYRANIDALKRLGVSDIVSLSACGSLQENLSPGTFVIVDQFIDRTVSREKSFFGEGCVAHVSMAEPVCGRLSGLLGEAARTAGARVVEGGTYLAMEGPQFSTKAESLLYRHWGCDVIGMTNMPEAKLAREAELPYAVAAMVTDYDCWREGEDHVDVAAVIAHLNANAGKARETVKALTSAMAGRERTGCAQGIETGLDFALITPPDARDPALVAKLDAVAGRAFAAERAKASLSA